MELRGVWMLLALVAGTWATSSAAATSNASIARKIDASKNVVQVRTIYNVRGAGSSYQFLIPEQLHARLAHMEVLVNGNYAAFRAGEQLEHFASYDVALGGKATAGGTVKVETVAVYTDVLEPHPKEILQTEKQYMRYTDTAYVPSPYPTLSETTDVLLAEQSPREYHTGVTPWRVLQKTVAYGPYTDLTPEDTMAGGFSRVDHKAQMLGRGVSSGAAFRRLIAEIPGSARDIYYRDNIGNISTSPLLLVLDTRYPMYGGWKTAWYQGYNIPSQDGLSVNSATGEYTLSMEFGVPFEELWVEDLTIKVILPEGARDVRADVPFTVETSQTRRHTYLDSPLLGGRLVLIMRKANVVAEHNIKFKVHYKFWRPLMLHEPLLLVGACLAFFLVAILAPWGCSN
ncbi:Ribophorin I [Tribonema minus]|uniref:Dolichyl-diphosphooligosaccharide--protein glycosyltransferase subunit 1 n=1 Tax=Tribonema minus TaxID=303371 RepID=A0A836CNP5_9STRA|nr:Ribophorin I [Tribonema minus]